MSYNDGRIRVRRYAGEHTLRVCILQRHRGPMPSVMIWGVIEYNMRSRLLRIEVNLNSNCYIREILQTRGTAPRTGNSTCHISAEQCPATRGKDCASFLLKTTGITASLACTFARYFTHRTCLVGDLFVRVLEHQFLMLCGLAYKLLGGSFPRKISRASLIPCHDAQRR